VLTHIALERTSTPEHQPRRKRDVADDRTTGAPEAILQPIVALHPFAQGLSSLQTSSSPTGLAYLAVPPPAAGNRGEAPARGNLTNALRHQRMRPDRLLRRCCSHVIGIRRHSMRHHFSSGQGSLQVCLPEQRSRTSKRPGLRQGGIATKYVNAAWSNHPPRTATVLSSHLHLTIRTDNHNTFGQCLPPNSVQTGRMTTFPAHCTICLSGGTRRSARIDNLQSVKTSVRPAAPVTILLKMIEPRRSPSERRALAERGVGV
jgi:hypothetical protein